MMGPLTPQRKVEKKIEITLVDTSGGWQQC